MRGIEWTQKKELLRCLYNQDSTMTTITGKSFKCTASKTHTEKCTFPSDSDQCLLRCSLHWDTSLHISQALIAN